MDTSTSPRAELRPMRETDLGAVIRLTVTRYVANRGARVLWVEHVIVDATTRSRGIGETMMRAHRFYERLGFVATHEGFKLAL